MDTARKIWNDKKITLAWLAVVAGVWLAEGVRCGDHYYPDGSL